MSKKPDYIAYSVQGEGETAQWTEVGAAWPHTNGDGFNVELKALPLGRLVLRKRKEKA